MATTTWGPLRHACTLCGGSCQSVGVVPIGEVERDRVRRHAAALGVAAPLDDAGALRRVAGRCVFLGEDDLCRIHARFGAKEKPGVCQQFPVVATRVGDEVRVGIDPACFTSITTARSAPVLAAEHVIVAPAPLADGLVPIEARVLDALRSATNPRAALTALYGDASAADAVLTRFVALVRAADFNALLRAGDVGPRLAAALAPLSDVGRFGVVSPEASAHAVDAAARVVWLRLGRAIDHPAVVATLALCGAEVLTVDAPDDATFGFRLAGWFRALRSPVVLNRLFSDPNRLRWLLTGA